MDAVIFPLPLEECRADVKNSLIQSGNAKACPVCRKEFTAAPEARRGLPCNVSR